MVEDKGAAKKLYMKAYDDANKQRIITQIMAKQNMIKQNSDKYVEDNRDEILEGLNNGKRLCLQMVTLAKYNYQC